MEQDNGDKPEGAKVGWRLLGTTYPFKTRWLTLREDHIELAGAGKLNFAYLDNPGAVGVVPITRDGALVLIKQYRYIVDEWCWEVPAGGLHDAEDASPEEMVRKELAEEIGAVCEDITYITNFYTAVGHTNQRFHVFLALGVELGGERNLEVTENIEVYPVPIAEAFRMARAGEIKDGVSALSILLCEGMLREQGYL